jgi:translation initiation factor eIF-2B subunit delta
VADPLSRIVGDDDRAASTAAALAAVVTEAEIATLVEREYARVTDATTGGGMGSQPPRLDVVVDRVMADLVRTPVQFLVDCRPLCIAQSAVIRYTKRIISEQAGILSAAGTNGAAHPLPAAAVAAFKEAVTEQMELFVDERICAAGDAIAALGSGKIVDGDVVLTYGANELVERLLTSALAAGRRFRVLLVSNPSSTGACIALLRRLVRAGAHCDFAPLTAVSHLVRRASKCFLGMDAMFNNGTGLASAGTALVASVAHDARVPVLALCQSYKYSERVQTDAITQNEMRDAAHVLSAKPGDQSAVSANDLKNSSVSAVGLVYDVTPASFIDVVVSEVGLVPPTSVPAVIREVVQPSQGPTR